MAIVFDSTIGGTATNAYVTVAELNQYRENMGLAVLETAASQVSIIKATAWIDAHYRSLWKTRNPANEGQSLHWPQNDATDSNNDTIDSDVIPEQVKQAVYEYTRRAASQTSLDPQEDGNTKSEMLEGLGKIEYFDRKSAGSLPSDFSFIDQILYGLIVGSSGGLRISTAWRV